MTAHIGIRLRFGDSWISVEPTDGDKFDIAVTDLVSRPVSAEARQRACAELLKAISRLREQLWRDELGGAMPSGGA